MQDAARQRRVEAQVGVQPCVGARRARRPVDDTVHVDVAGQALAALVGDGRLAVGEDDRLSGSGPRRIPQLILDAVPVRVGERVRRAQRVAEDVGVDLAEVVGDLAGPAGEAVLARVVLAVGRGDVGEDLRP